MRSGGDKGEGRRPFGHRPSNEPLSNEEPAAVNRWEGSGESDLRLVDLRITLTTFGTVHCHDPPPAMPASPGIWLGARGENPHTNGQAHVETFLGAERTIALRGGDSARFVFPSRPDPTRCEQSRRFTDEERHVPGGPTSRGRAQRGSCGGEETTFRQRNTPGRRFFAPLRGRAHPPSRPDT